MKPSASLLIRRGRVLTPASRTRYRWLRLRTGRAMFLQGDGFVAIVGSAVRVLTLPLFALIDLLWWPIARITIARSGWTVVRVDFDGPDAEFVRVAEAASKTEAMTRRDEIARTSPG